MARKLNQHAAYVLMAAVAGTATTISTYMDQYTEPSGVRQYEDKSDRSAAWLADCLRDDNQLFVESRLRRDVFEALVEYLESSGVRGGHASVAEKLLLFLYICGHGVGFRNASYRCGRSLDTISQYVVKNTSEIGVQYLQSEVTFTRSLTLYSTSTTSSYRCLRATKYLIKYATIRVGGPPLSIALEH